MPRSPLVLRLSILPALLLLLCAGCTLRGSEGEGTTYRHLNWLIMAFILGFGVPSLLLIALLPFQLAALRKPRSWQDRDDAAKILRVSALMIPVGVALACGLYAVATAMVVEVGPDSFTDVVYGKRSEYRYRDLQEMVVHSSIGGYTGSSGEFLLLKFKPGVRRTEFSDGTTRVPFGPSMPAALPDLFQRARAQGVLCLEDPADRH